MEQLDVYTVDELASMLRMSRRSVWEHIRKGHIPGSFKIGRRVFVRREGIEKLMDDEKRSSLK